jgi:hypothetical protein
MTYASTGLLSTFLAAGFRVVPDVDSPQATDGRVIVRRGLAVQDSRWTDREAAPFDRGS